MGGADGLGDHASCNADRFVPYQQPEDREPGRLGERCEGRNRVRLGFWTYVIAHQSAPGWLSPVLVSFVFAVVSMPASILGNEVAIRFGRHRAITVAMIASAAVAVIIALNVSAPAWALAVLLLVYGLTVPADSGALTSGMSAAATREHRGVTLALHSTVGLSAAGALGDWSCSRFCRRAPEPGWMAAGVRGPCGRDLDGAARADVGPCRPATATRPSE